MFHGRSRLNYERESAAAVENIREIAWRALHFFNEVLLLKLFFRFCVACEGFDSAWNVLKNFKTIFTNVYCLISNRLHKADLPPFELETLGVAFRGYYHKILYPTADVVKYQVGVYFKTAGLQMLLQALRFHTSRRDAVITRAFDRVTRGAALPRPRERPREPTNPSSSRASAKCPTCPRSSWSRLRTQGTFRPSSGP